MPTGEGHLDERARLAAEPEDRFEQQQRQDAGDRELAARHDAGHDHVRTRDVPDRLEGRQSLAEEKRRAHHVDQNTWQCFPDRERRGREDAVPAGEPANALGTQRKGEESADHRGGDEEGAQRARPSSNQRSPCKDEREDYERQSEIFSAAEHAHPSGWMSHSQTRSQRPALQLPPGRLSQASEVPGAHDISRVRPFLGVDWEMAAIEATDARGRRRRRRRGRRTRNELQKRRHGETEVTLKLAFRADAGPAIGRAERSTDAPWAQAACDVPAACARGASVDRPPRTRGGIGCRSSIVRCPLR